MSREEILEKIKNKFLAIGRTKGLYSGKNKDKLISQNTFINNIIHKIALNKKSLMFISVTLLVLILVIFNI